MLESFDKKRPVDDDIPLVGLDRPENIGLKAQDSDPLVLDVSRATPRRLALDRGFLSNSVGGVANITLMGVLATLGVLMSIDDVRDFIFDELKNMRGDLFGPTLFYAASMFATWYLASRRTRAIEQGKRSERRLIVDKHLLLDGGLHLDSATARDTADILGAEKLNALFAIIERYVADSQDEMGLLPLDQLPDGFVAELSNLLVDYMSVDHMYVALAVNRDSLKYQRFYVAMSVNRMMEGGHLVPRALILPEQDLDVDRLESLRTPQLELRVNMLREMIEDALRESPEFTFDIRVPYVSK